MARRGDRLGADQGATAEHVENAHLGVVVHQRTDRGVGGSGGERAADDRLRSRTDVLGVVVASRMGTGGRNRHGEQRGNMK